MPSDPLEESPAPPQSKARQERIRDNQRRSRARRQEYLADLEKRLSECQITCRDADIQRAAFIELQIENTRLRELLALAGVNDHFVEHYVSQAVAQAGQYPPQANPTLRQLKPKISSVDTTRMMAGAGSSSQPNVNTSFPRRSSNMASSTSGMSMPDLSKMSTPSPSYTPDPSFMHYPLDMGTPSDFDWSFQPSPLPQPQSPPERITCEAFGITAMGVTRVADENSVLCSVAKQMIDQYNIPPTEMERVKAVLSQGFCRPAFPGADCAIDNQVLFQVLNDLNVKYS